MKPVDDVTDQVVLDLTIIDSPLHEENQEIEKKELSKILQSIRRHSFTNGTEMEKSDFSNGSAVLNHSLQNGDLHSVTTSNTPNGHLTRSVSETNVSVLPSKNIYFIPMPNKSSTSVLSNDSCYTGEVASFASATTIGEAVSLDSGVYDFLGPPSPQFEMEEKKEKCNVNKEEKATTIAFQVLIPYLIAGIGTCGAGLVLDSLQHWTVFQNISELFVVVTPLLGLKGNLEMTLASRLSTQANLGHLNTFKTAWKQGWGNMVLKLAQATIMGLIAAIFAIISNIGNFNYEHALLLCCSCLGTATLTTVGLGTITTTVVVFSHRFKINPDNIATPVAASLGDITTLGVLALLADKLYTTKEMVAIPSVTLGVMLLLVPFWVYCAKKNIYTQRLILTGWLPIIIAVVITSGGGFILEKALRNFEGMAVFQPVINGIGGNLVAVQASRIATYFHQRSKLGTMPSTSNKLCISPFSAFFGKNDHSRTAIILMLLVVPGHLIFAYSIHWIKGGDTSLSIIFTPIYLSAALIQVAVLLYIAHCMIHWMWRLKIDPDNSAIPFLTALGDLFGTGLLAIAFFIFQQVNHTDTYVTTSPTLPPNATYFSPSFASNSSV